MSQTPPSVFLIKAWITGTVLAAFVVVAVAGVALLLDAGLRWLDEVLACRFRRLRRPIVSGIANIRRSASLVASSMAPLLAPTIDRGKN